MKTAVLYSGQLRGFNLIRDDINKNLLNFFGDCDNYFYVSDLNSESNLLNFTTSDKILIEKDDLNSLPDWKVNSTLDGAPFINFLYQWRGVMKCKDLMLKQNKRYDYVIRIRPDVFFVDDDFHFKTQSPGPYEILKDSPNQIPWPWEHYPYYNHQCERNFQKLPITPSAVNPNKINTMFHECASVISSEDGGNCNATRIGINDKFAIGSFDNMIKYCDFYKSKSIKDFYGNSEQKLYNYIVNECDLEFDHFGLLIRSFIINSEGEVRKH